MDGYDDDDGVIMKTMRGLNPTGIATKDARREKTTTMRTELTRDYMIQKHREGKGQQK